MVPSSDAANAADTVRVLVERARAAQHIADSYSQERVDEIGRAHV